MKIHERTDGTFVAAELITTKKRYRTTLTKDFLPSEAASLDELANVRTYTSSDSLRRAIRKYKSKL